MQAEQPTTFDSEELLHLAIHAVDTNDNENAIRYLKQLLDLEPRHGNAHYLLGAVHASLGMYERAIEDMSRAIALDPDLPATAHFQLGLLHMTSGRVDEARHAWSALDKLGEDDALFLFKRGMLSLAEDAYDACIADLERGIALNRANDDLNRDMRAIVERAEAARTAPGKPAADSPERDGATRGAGHVLLSAYRRSEPDQRDDEPT